MLTIHMTDRTEFLESAGQSFWNLQASIGLYCVFLNISHKRSAGEKVGAWLDPVVGLTVTIIGICNQIECFTCSDGTILKSLFRTFGRGLESYSFVTVSRKASTSSVILNCTKASPKTR